jgi:fumarate reductase flavoprotein subunit
MAVQAGAAVTGLDRFYGHTLSRDSLTNDELWPFPVLDRLVAASVVVNAKGERFLDEGTNGIHIANQLVQSIDALNAWAVCDHTTWIRHASADPIQIGASLSRGRGTHIVANDWQTLARHAEIAYERLDRTIGEFNWAAKHGTGGTLSPPHGGGSQSMVQPPFHAVPIIAGLTYTMGGVVINEHCKVLDVSRKPLPGLYACGTTVGGVEGGPSSGYVGGLAQAFILGLVSAEAASQPTSVVRPVGRLGGVGAADAAGCL